MKRRAFSLLELLVVVGVLAIIAAILFPMFSRTSESDGRKSQLPKQHEANCTWLQAIHQRFR